MRSPFRTSERHSPRSVSSVDERMIDVRHRFAYELVESYATENARLLDIGSGEGYGATIAGRYVAEYVGVDVSQTAVDAAQARYGGQNVSFGAIRDNTFPSEADRFDLLISFQVIEHVDDVSQYLSEIRRVAVDGATLLITTPNRTLRLRSRRTSVESSPRPRIRRGRAPRRARDPWAGDDLGRASDPRIRTARALASGTRSPNRADRPPGAEVSTPCRHGLTREERSSSTPHRRFGCTSVHKPRPLDDAGRAPRRPRSAGRRPRAKKHSTCRDRLDPSPDETRSATREHALQLSKRQCADVHTKCHRPVSGLNPAPTRRASLLDRADVTARQRASCERVPQSLQHAPSRPAERDGPAVLESNGSEQLDELIRVVSSMMTDQRVSSSKTLLVRGHRENRRSTWAEMCQPPSQSCGIVGDVLDHLEGTHEVERLLRGEHLDVSMPHVTGPPQSLGCDGERTLVRLKSDICVSACEARSKTALATSDLESVMCLGRKQTRNDVPAQPGIWAQWRTPRRHRPA